MEDGFDLQGFRGLNLERNDGAGFVHRYEQSFADGKNIARINDRAGLGANDQGSSQSFGRQHSIPDPKAQMKITENFYRINPRFERTAFIAKKCGMLTYR